MRSRTSPLRTAFRRRHPQGFTLVEMLVAVALVLLMMTLFAQVFQMAGGTITTQRGIAENDQRSRTVQNIIKGDLDKRTSRMAMPWSVGEDGSLADTDAILREGYFYISENDPLNDADDEIQFTFNVNTRVKNPDTTAQYGKATAQSTWTGTDSSGNTFLGFANQPEADDGWTTPNGTAEAPAAEVAYFVRGGKLYRRVLLIRKPLPLSGSDGQPTFTYSGSTYDAFDNTVTMPMGATIFPYATGLSFWNDYDYSAFPQAGAGGAGPVARFHSVDDLSNASTLTQFPLGIPQFRFGHALTGTVTTTGRPREFDVNGVYFGRFLHEETSDANFHYPNGNSTVGNPMTVGLALNTTTNVFPDFIGGLRRGEDLLLSNVHSFDVKVWDSGALGGAGAFVDIGRSISPADPHAPNAVDFATANRSNVNYGPINPSSPFPAPYTVNRVFDSWYPFASGVLMSTDPALKIDLDSNNQNDPPPFRHVIYGAGATSGSYGVAVGQSPNLVVKQQPTWLAGTNYVPGDLVFPSQLPANQRNNGLRFYYRCVSVVGTPSTSRTEPTTSQWPAVAGARFQDPDTDPANHYVWEAVDNWKPLRAIQITIRFHDVTSDQIRQQTIVHSLVD